MSEITPFSNTIQYIPKDSPYSEKGQIYPVDHFAITETEIAAIESGQGSSSNNLVDPNNTPSSGGAGGGVSLDNLVPLIVDYGPIDDQTISALEPTVEEYTLTAFADVRNINVDFLEFQWEKQELGSTTWSDISGATSESYILPVGLNTTNDSGDSYRCRISHPNAINSPVYTASWTLNLRRVITITSQPISSPGLNQGDTDTLSITATITSGTINYQWQRRDVDSPDFIDIPGATSSSYITPELFSATDTGDQYRCVLSAEYADNVTSESTEIFIIGSDIKVQPAVNGITFWSFKDHGSLILDPSLSSSYQLTNVASNRDRLPIIMWGQGTCAAQGGYTEGAIPVEFQDVYTVRLNAGRGAAGLSDSGRYAESGGGYAGIFDGTEISQSSALMIAGGAGGGSLNTNTCGNNQISVGYPVTTSYVGTCYNNINNSGCVSHSYNNAICGDNYLNYSSSFSTVFTTGCGTRQYYVFYRNPFPDTNYSFSVYGVGSCTAAGGACPGFYVSSAKYTWGALLQFYRRDTGANSYVSSFCISASGSYPYSCTQYTTTTYYYDGRSPSYGGDGGGTTGGTGDNGSGSLISATGGGGASQSSGGSAGTTTSGGNTNGTAGSALQGGAGGRNSGSNAAAGGGGGGGGYFGGGGGAGGYDNANVTTSSGIGPQAGGGGGGGSGYIDVSVINGTVSTYSNASDPDRGTAGDSSQNSRLVIKESYIDITSQPTSVAISEGSTATFTVEASLVSYFNDSTISYQWQKKSSGSLVWNNISGATSASYTTGSLAVSNNQDSYRCSLTNIYAENLTSDEVYTLVSPLASSKFIVETPGQYTIPIPTNAKSFVFKLWGAGGGGTGEGSDERGGSGGFASGEIAIPTNNTSSLVVFVGATDAGSPVGMSGYGAGRGGQRSELSFGSNVVYVGGGGGAAQKGDGGYGGGAGRSGGGGNGTYQPGGGASTSSGGAAGGSSAGSGTTGRSGGGAAGGYPYNTGNRGGGGGSGLYGGGGGGGGNGTTGLSGGGGGGSGYKTGTFTNFVTSDGSQGKAGGATIPYSNDPDYVTGHGGSGQNGLAVIDFNIDAGEVEFTTPSTYSWTCPEGVESVCVVCVGGGAGGDNGFGTSSGGGGGLGWKNNISVTPGQTYTVVVGNGGSGSGQNYDPGYGTSGGDSYFINTSTVKGGGGQRGTGGSYVGDGGGNGGSGVTANSGQGGGGGGAGGYSGNGGTGGYASNGGAGSGGGGGGGAKGLYGFDYFSGSEGTAAGNGGGVGIYGEGTSGAGGTDSGSGSTRAGKGGSGGNDGNLGGAFGGGGALGFQVQLGQVFGRGGGSGGSGAVRIIWGEGRSFPDNAESTS